MEPLSNGQIGDKHFVHCSEVVHYSEGEMYIGRELKFCLFSECPLLGVLVLIIPVGFGIFITNTKQLTGIYIFESVVFLVVW